MTEILSNLTDYIKGNEYWLMERILSYAKERDYTKYTSTLVEPWRLSISGLSESFVKLVESRGDNIDLSPDEDYESDPATQFGIIEAQRHRERGISLEMFLGLMKYYNQSYQDLIRESGFENEKKQYYTGLINRFFDRVEIAFCKAWTSPKKEQLITELQKKNRRMTNEKNKYLTIFESLSIAVIITDSDGIIENMNLAAANMFNKEAVSGSKYYSEINENMYFYERFPELEKNYINFIKSGKEKTADDFYHDFTEQYFHISFSSSLDISGKFSGTIIMINEITKHKEMEKKLEKLAETDPLTGANNRRSFLKFFEKELKRCKRYTRALAIIMIDIDHFKDINDKYGHDAGDEVLKLLVKKAHSVIRSTDIFCRWGG